MRAPALHLDEAGVVHAPAIGGVPDVDMHVLLVEVNEAVVDYTQKGVKWDLEHA